MLITLKSSEEIQSKVLELAAAIKADLNGEPAVFIGVLKGAFLFLSDLAKHLGEDAMFDFIQVSSYGAEQVSSGKIRILKDVSIQIEGLNVIIVEDIEDTGLTLRHLSDLLQTRNPKSLRLAAMFSKAKAKGCISQLDYVGFEIPNEFVVGYGLDYAERYRALPFVAILQSE